MDIELPDKAFLNWLRYLQKHEPEYVPTFVESYKEIQDRIAAFWAEREKEVIWRA